MTKTKFISAFTPSNTDPAILQRIFVQRQRLLDKIVNRLSQSMSTADKYHALLIGPRGCGKTHFITLAQADLRKRVELQDVMRVAWLGEDDTITGFIDLATGIANQLIANYPGEFPDDYRAHVRGLSGDDAATSILNWILDHLKHRNILLLMENMDRAFAGLGDLGQKKWRAFLQEHPRIATLATSQQLFTGVKSRDDAFWGFYDIHHLEPLVVEEARELIDKISTEQGRNDLSDYLISSQGRYRIRSLHHLAGGNHRMYVLLAEFLTRESLDDLVSAFEQLAEELTPYFQERVRSLSPQQARIVQCLCNAEGALTVKQVAEDTFIAERNCSKQLGDLKSKGYVRSEKRGKESYYEMAEPLMRLCLEVKNQRGKPLQLVAKFLKAWFPADRLKAELAAGAKLSRTQEYLQYALVLPSGYEEEVDRELMNEVNQCIDENQFEKGLILAKELEINDPERSIRLQEEVHFRTAEYIEQQGNLREAIDEYTKLITVLDSVNKVSVRGLIRRGNCFFQSNQFKEAIADFTNIIDLPDLQADTLGRALLGRGGCYVNTEQYQKAIDDFLQVSEMPVQPKTKSMALYCIAFYYTINGEMYRSAEYYRNSIALHPANYSLFGVVDSEIANASRDEAISSLKRAFAQGDPQEALYGGYPKSILFQVLKRGSDEWLPYLSEVVPLYVEHGVAELLGTGLTQSIGQLDKGDYSHTQLDTWYQAWQKAALNVDELQIPLKALHASIEAIKTKSDRPLFELPLEIRRLVRPLLENTLGKVEE